MNARETATGLAILVASVGCQFEHGTLPGSEPGSEVDGGDTSDVCPGYGAMTAWGSRYRTGIESLPWLEAEAGCESDGATTHLVVIGDIVERDAVSMLATDPSWIGTSDRVVEMTWRDVTGEVTAFTPWLGMEPSAKPDEDCVLMAAMGPDRGGYDAKNCPERHPYVCECDGAVADAAGY